MLSQQSNREGAKPKTVPKEAQEGHSDRVLPYLEHFTTILNRFWKQQQITMGKCFRQRKEKNLRSVLTSQRVTQASLHQSPFYHKDAIPLSPPISSVHATCNSSFIYFHNKRNPHEAEHMQVLYFLHGTQCKARLSVYVRMLYILQQLERQNSNLTLKSPIK